MDMTSRIEHITATQVIVHARSGYVDRDGFGPSIFDKIPKWLLEIRTDDGLIGYGETPRGASLSDVQDAARQVMGRSLREFPWSRPVQTEWDKALAWGHKNPPVPHRYHERELGTPPGALGVSVAVQDLIAKSTDRRLVDLFGGPHREAVRTDWWVGRTDPDHVTQQMQIGLDLGYNSLKVKAAAEDDVVGIVRAYKQVAGEKARLVIDPNTRFYRAHEAIRIARSIEQYENVVFEDPFAFDIQEWKLFRRKTTVPLVMHSTTQPWVALSNRCCDYVNLAYPAARFLGNAHMAGEFGVLCWAGSGVELGVLDAYLLHYSAAARVCVLPGDAFGHDVRENDLINETLQPCDGHIPLPEGPGLGVSIDQDALDHYAQNRWELGPDGGS